ncbi:hypothetical protein EVAR_61880_1 [Eumeta japonica]|uniref:Uncharacterized protein n=1 Tax=Eumeta variegata TaxID=151549 RepID=A0A4C1Z0E3_EUMVA|nr:hypothetical protein EVAR_61880_1 [Eumeta japonica]
MRKACAENEEVVFRIGCRIRMWKTLGRAANKRNEIAGNRPYSLIVGVHRCSPNRLIRVHDCISYELVGSASVGCFNTPDAPCPGESGRRLVYRPAPPRTRPPQTRSPTLNVRRRGSLAGRKLANGTKRRRRRASWTLHEI